jgi:hypothetical protein
MNCDNETLVTASSSTVRTYPLIGSVPSNPAGTGYYVKDVRWRSTVDESTGHSGGAYADYGITRTLVVVDNEVGSSVFKGLTSDGTDVQFEDRSAAGNTYAEELHKMLSGVRWGGTMHIEGGPMINPLQRVTIIGVPDYGDITFAPQRVTWDSNTGLRQYVLGDQKHNPLAELQLRQRLGLRDRADMNRAKPAARQALLMANRVRV